MDLTEFQVSDLLNGPIMQIWIRIMQWVWVFLIFYINAQLMRGGFDDILDILRSPYATPRERFQARTKTLTRTLALMLAGVLGATQIALPVWFQGGVLILLWHQISQALGS